MSGGLQEEDRLGGQIGAGLGRVIAVVEADADNLADVGHRRPEPSDVAHHRQLRQGGANRAETVAQERAGDVRCQRSEVVPDLVVAGNDGSLSTGVTVPGQTHVALLVSNRRPDGAGLTRRSGR